MHKAIFVEINQKRQIGVFEIKNFNYMFFIINLRKPNYFYYKNKTLSLSNCQLRNIFLTKINSFISHKIILTKFSFEKSALDYILEFSYLNSKLNMYLSIYTEIYFE